MEGNGARIILKSHYVKASNNASGGTSRYASYIATREGAVKIGDSTRANPATKSQMKFIDQLTAEFPSLKEGISYLSYDKEHTVGKASDLIDDAIDSYGSRIMGLEGYAKYMATRPGSVQIRESGLFSDGDKPVDLDKVMEELKNYRGNVYMPIISLRPEDSIGYGYDNPEAWHKLIESHRDEIAREFKIPAEHFRWVGAYHHATNEEGYVHNHIHMIIWSTNPSDGWQSTMTGNNIRAILAKDIFANELQNIYEEKTVARNAIKEEASHRLSVLLDSINDFPTQANNTVCIEFMALADSLKDTKGRKYYKYLPKEQKLMVDNIMNDLVDSDVRLKQMLETWAEAKDRQVKIFSSGSYVLPPISEIKEFNGVKNNIINQAVAYNKDLLVSAQIKKLEAKEQAHEEFLAQQGMHSVARALANRMAHSFDRPHKVYGPHQKRNKDAESIDEQVRRSQGMK